MPEVTLNVPKMSCGHCTMTVENAGKALAGVQSVKADLETKQVSVSYDESAVSLDEIKQAITDSGYPVG